MLTSFRQLFRARGVAKVATVPPGQRVYAVGDIHGRADLFAALIDAIEKDDAHRNRPASASAPAGTTCETTIVLLGDLIDRGPASATVLALAQQWQNARPVRILCGNHEEMLLEGLASADTLHFFLRHGGHETMLSFGLDPELYTSATYEGMQALMNLHIPEATVAFIRSFEEQVRIGDYLFVHAGIRPGIPLADQQRADLLWIRDPFLSHGGDLGVVVVHGHTIAEEPQIRDHRIGIDTGAYFTGNLTAIGLEGGERWLIEACESAEGIVTSVSSIKQPA